MKHFVLTRLGLTITDPAWYDGKFPIFEQICFASMINQRDQNFTWIIALDARAPDTFKQRLEALTSPYNNFVVVHIDVSKVRHIAMPGFSWVWYAALEQGHLGPYLPDAEEYIITSIIDDDDAWHQETTSRVSIHFSNKVKSLSAEEDKRSYLLSPSNGAVLTFETGDWFYLDEQKVDRRNWPFHSMSIFVLSRFYSGVTAYSVPHLGWRHFCEVLKYDLHVESTDFPMWLYTQHAGALSQKSNPSEKVSLISEEQCAQFGLSLAALRAITEFAEPEYVRESKNRLREVYVAASQRYLKTLKEY